MEDDDSEPPTLPDGLRARRELYQRGPESLLPPRARPSAALGVSVIGGAAACAYSIPSPTIRALVMLACGLALWVVGYFTPSPRRHSRRDDAPRW